MAVSLSLASERGSVPMDWRLYLPEKWAKDRQRRKKAGVPEELKFQTKPEIALEQIRATKASGVPITIVLPMRGMATKRRGVKRWRRCVAVLCWSAIGDHGMGSRTGPVPPTAKNKTGRPATRWQRVAGSRPLSVKALAESLTAQRWRTVAWREGTNAKLSSRFAAVRVRAAHRDEQGLRAPRAEQWLLIEWPVDQAEPSKYWLSTLPAGTALVDLSKPLKCAGALKGTIRSLSTIRLEPLRDGACFLISPPCVRGYVFVLGDRLQHCCSKKTPLDQSDTPTPRLHTSRQPNARNDHVPDTSTTLRFASLRRSSKNSFDVPAAMWSINVNTQ